MKNIIILFVAFFICADTLDAQKIYGKPELLEVEKSHIKSGWVNSIGVHIHPSSPVLMLDDFDSYNTRYNVQYDYLGYFMFNPRVGLGMNISYTKYASGEVGIRYESHYHFLDVGLYGKMVIVDKKPRFFADLKMGYSQTLNSSIPISCNDCSGAGSLYVRYKSGPMIQPGIGLDFATSDFVKWGLKLSSSFSFIDQQNDIPPRLWRSTDTGIIKRTRGSRVLNAFFLGLNFSF